MAIDRLHQAAIAVDVIDAAGRIIAHPRRHAPSASAGEVLAIAHAFERAWEVAIEAELLVRALRLPRAGDRSDETIDLAIQRQADRVSELMAAIRG